MLALCFTIDGSLAVNEGDAVATSSEPQPADSRLRR